VACRVLEGPVESSASTEYSDSTRLWVSAVLEADSDEVRERVEMFSNERLELYQECAFFVFFT
jgi:hypothetical protein